MDIRRVVTGHDAAGKAVFVSDAAVAPFTPAMMPGAGSNPGTVPAVIAVFIAGARRA
jgi:hypothetical protein